MPQFILGEFHQALLSPKLTVLIIVDHQVAFNSCFDDEALEMVEEGVVELVATAGKVGVPVIASSPKSKGYLLYFPSLSMLMIYHPEP
ncbi:MAG: hypothetical protein COB78_13005 [Hyphomicrobiales bacterium]|nr:MAG: hypothetical protein COB78_13005 [Hyphomicrobiales bacterium]